MGLDHWVKGRQYVSTYGLQTDDNGNILDNNYNKNQKKDVELQKVLSGVLSEFNCNNGTEGFKVQNIEYGVITWRKANQIHGWFVNNVQNGNDDCGEYYVSNQQLDELLTICKEIKSSGWNPKLIHSTLPPTEGFFFGGYELDEYYKQDVEATIEALSKLHHPNIDHLDFYYASSW